MTLLMAFRSGKASVAPPSLVARRGLLGVWNRGLPLGEIMGHNLLTLRHTFVALTPDPPFFPRDKEIPLPFFGAGLAYRASLSPECALGAPSPWKPFWWLPVRYCWRVLCGVGHGLSNG